MSEPQDLARLVSEFGKAYTRRIWAEMSRTGTTPARARLMMVLQCQGCCTMGDVGDRLGVTARNVTKLVDGLEIEGLVVREPHPNDRRATLLRLTEKGVLVCKESAMADHAAAAWVYERLSTVDRGHLARILGELLERLSPTGADSERGMGNDPENPRAGSQSPGP